MSTKCSITGTLLDLTGAPLANTKITFVRQGVAAQDGATVIPQYATATSDANGMLSITLFAGNYIANTFGPPNGTISFSVAVPAQATAVLSDLIDAAPTTVTPQAVIDAQAARDAAAASATVAGISETNAASSATSAASSATDAAASATAAANAAVNMGAIKFSAQVIGTDTTISAGFNGYSVGPIEIAAGVTVDVLPGSVWTII